MLSPAMAGKQRDKKAAGAPAAAPPSESTWGLRVLVVVAGAVLMALEIVGSRLLAPHFGNSVFVWGSLISVFLMALSAGYFVGGQVADRDPSVSRLSGLCVVVAALVFGIPLAGHPLCAWLTDRGLGEQTGPLVAATLLFLPPSFLLGMVSPFAVRLATKSLQSVGRAAGSLYALSTVGSIAGTLLTTFVLIPTLGVSWILKGLAVAMLLAPLGMILSRPRVGGAFLTPAVVAGIGLLLPMSPAAQLSSRDHVVVDEDTPYHHIQVVDVNGVVRHLRFDRYVESSIQLAPPHATTSEYTNYFHLAYLLKPDLRSALFIGAGGGIGPRSFHAMSPDAAIDVVDVDRRVLEVAERQFFMPVGNGVRTFARDGRMFLRTSRGGYDCIVLDAFTIGGRIPFHLATKEAFELCRDRLAPGGVFVMNTNSSIEGESARIFRAVGATLQLVFPRVEVFAVGWRRYPDPRVARNVIFVATTDATGLSPRDWEERASRYVARSTVTPATVRDMVQDLLPRWPDLTGAEILTDEHAPIETMRF